jgi:Terminase RNaseH-like domain
MSTVTIEAQGRAVTVPRSAALEIARDPVKERALYECATSFRTFLDHWMHLDAERQKHQLLGPNLWPGQARLADAMEDPSTPWLLIPKARKLGISSLEVAFAAWVARFHPDSYVPMISYRQQASDALKRQTQYGLERLPPFLALPMRSTTKTIDLEGGGQLEAYPASERTAVDRTATHLVLDELARCINPEALWQAVQPSAAGTLHCLTTILGPESFAADLTRRAQLGETRLHLLFISALERPGRDERWLQQMAHDLGSGRARQEYPLQLEDAMSGTGERFFPAEAIDRATQDCYPLRGFTPASDRPLRYRNLRPRYVTGVDIGVRDAFCAVVLDVTEPVWDVAAFVHRTGLSYPEMAREIERLRAIYPGVRVTVESNNAGSAVIQNLPFQVESFWTSAKSKAEILYNLQARLEAEELKISPEAERLLYELRLYQVPDTAIPQDAVMALAIACHAATTNKPGRALSPILVG